MGWVQDLKDLGTPLERYATVDSNGRFPSCTCYQLIKKDIQTMCTTYSTLHSALKP